MKVLERSKAKAGSYEAKYKNLIRPKNKVGLKETKSGLRLMFRLEDEHGNELPASVGWDAKDERARSALAALGISSDELFKRAKAKSDEQAILWFDKTARAAAEEGITVNAYVREDGGFASGLRPMNGKFVFEFLEIKSRDDKGKPIWTYVPGKPPSGKRKFPSDPMNRFWVSFKVIAGARKGVVLDKMYHYAIVEDGEGEWVLDAESTRGTEFKKLLTMHGIPAGNLKPDVHFKDAKNGLPEIELMLKKKKRPLQGEMEGGWLNDVGLPPEGLIPADAVDVGDDAEDANKARLVSMIERRVRDAKGKAAWLSDGRISKSGVEWVRENLGVVLKKRGIDVHLAEIDSDDSEFVIGVLKNRFPLKKA